jgi:hypothetical protein
MGFGCNNFRLNSAGVRLPRLECGRTASGRSATVDPNAGTNCRFATHYGLSREAAFGKAEVELPQLPRLSFLVRRERFRQVIHALKAFRVLFHVPAFLR